MFFGRVVHKEDISGFRVLSNRRKARRLSRFIFFEPEGSCVAVVVEEASFGDLQEIPS